MDKPFKTIDEQVKLLQQRGISTDAQTSQILEREGYYPLVNGYKDPFLDTWSTAMAGDDRYKVGTRFSDLRVLFDLDRSLRALFMKHFAMAEATLKAACSYVFTEAHPDELNPYLNPAHYSNEKRKRQGIRDLIVDLKSALGIGKRDCKYKRSYLQHYVGRHGGEVPLWVLMNYLTLGQAFKFYDFQSEGIQNRIAKRFSALYGQSHPGKRRIDPRRLRLAYDHIKDFRNICAHDERFYCSRVSRSGDVSVRQVTDDLEMILPAGSYAELMGECTRLVRAAEELFSYPVGVAALMGWESMEELEQCSLDARGR